MNEWDRQKVQNALEAMRRGDTSVYLRGGTTFVAGAREIAEELSVNRSLISLDLTSTKISDEYDYDLVGATAIAEALHTNKCLASLILTDTFIGDEGGIEFARALVVNKCLTTLRLDGNYIRANGAKAIAAALFTNKCLTTLRIDRNMIGGEGVKAFAAALRVNRCLTSLDVSYNKVDDEGAVAIIDVLLVNDCITFLDLVVSLHVNTYFANILRINDTLLDVPSGNPEVRKCLKFNRLWGKRSRLFKRVWAKPDCDVEC